MFTETKPSPSGPRRRSGRPVGRTDQGHETRKRLYRVATKLFRRHGFEGTTLRALAAEARVSPALVYRYFPGKDALVMELHDELSKDFADRTRELPRGRWRERFLFALRASLEVLEPDRETLVALIPMLVSRRQEGIFSRATDFARERVQGAFEAAVVGASDAPGRAEAAALGRLLYLGHLGVLLWWLLDKSPKRRATELLLGALEKALGPISLALKLSATRRLMLEFDAAASQALFGEGQARDEESRP